MLASLIRWSFRILTLALSVVGIAALILAAMIATPLVAPPELQSISAARGTVDMSTLPGIERFQARDGTALGFRHYAAIGPSTGRAAIVTGDEHLHLAAPGRHGRQIVFGHVGAQLAGKLEECGHALS